MNRLLLATALLLVFLSPAGAFDIPERLEYEITWLGITAGHSSLEIAEIEGARLRIVSMANSVDWVTKLFPVDDRVESIIETLPHWFPVTFRLENREGKRVRDYQVDFDQSSQVARYKDFVTGEESVHELPQRVYDPLSALYAVRDNDLFVGQSTYVMLFDSEQLYELEVRVIRRERVEVPAGTFDTVLIAPMLQSEGIFSREGPIYTWVTDDERRIPVQIKTRVRVGSIYAKLTRIVNEAEQKD